MKNIILIVTAIIAIGFCQIYIADYIAESIRNQTLRNITQASIILTLFGATVFTIFSLRKPKRKNYKDHQFHIHPARTKNHFTNND